MENESINSLVYSKQVVGFVTVAGEFCELTENVLNFSAEENLRKMQLILPLLYLKAALLPRTEKILDDELEKFVTEMDYQVLQQRWLGVLGEHDTYYEVFDPDIQFGKETTTASISESLLDIYQDMKNFITSYSMGDESIMNDSLFECVSHFDDFWGQRLVNVLRAIHMLLTGGIELQDEKGKRGNTGFVPGKSRPQWFDRFFNAGADEL
jgi:hypothetical protein